MHAETFLREFAPLASGPGGIQKLRELVLQLAVRGKLVPQNLVDGTASELLAQIKSEKVRLAKSGVFRRDNTESLAPSDQCSFPVPISWEWIPATFATYGVSDLGKKVKTKDVLDAGDFPVVDQGKVPVRGYCNDPEKVIKVSSPLIVFGDHTREIKLIDFDFVVGADGVKLLQPVGVDASYYFLALRWLPLDSRGYGRHFKLLKASSIPLPPLAEQKRIVAKVDELMALCDALEARQAEETGLKRAAAASALHHLSEAKTPQETADRWSLLAPRFGELFDDLETIKALQDSVYKLATSGRLISLPRPANKTTLGKHVDLISGQHLKPEEYNETRNGLPYITGPADFGPISPKPNRWTTERRAIAINGDVLVTVKGSGIGKTNVVLDGEFAISRQLIAVRAKDIDGGYMKLALQAGAESFKQSQVGIAIPGIGRKDIQGLGILLPPLAEQKRIVAKVDELMALCHRLEEQVREGERLNAALMASLVHALTETDPDGGGAVEPAGFAESPHAFAAPEAANSNAAQAPETKSALATVPALSESRPAPQRAPGVDTKFQEAVLVAAIVKAFFDAPNNQVGEPIGNFRLQKAVYFARRHIGEHVGEMAYLKKAAGPYNPSMKYSGGIAIAKQKNWLREARGRFGFGHVPGPDVGDTAEWIDTYGYGGPARWVAEHFRFKKNEEWETLATVDYAMEHLRSLDIDPDAEQILQYIRADDEWRPKIEKLALTEMSVGTAMVEVSALFSGTDGVITQ